MRKVLHFASVLCAIVAPAAASAATFSVTIDGGDAIFLAGRTDIVVPDPSLPWPGGLTRHGGPTPEEIQETLPPILSVAGGDVIRLLDPAEGGINFYNGFGPPFFGPEGDAGASNLGSFGGVSGYNGRWGSLVGVFLTDDVPNGAPPPALDFATIGTDFLSLAPGLGQVFFIGNGRTGGNDIQTFTTPAGATRLALGIADGFGFVGAPGAYDDNDGAYRVLVGINEIPQVPAPAAGGLLLAALAALARVGSARRRRG